MNVRQPHPIEVASYEILRSRVDLSPMPPLWRAVTERVIHASADVEYAVDLATDERHLRQGLDALRAGAPIVADVPLVAAGITERPVVCPIDDPADERRATETLLDRNVDGVILATARLDDELPASLRARDIPHVLALRTDRISPSSLGDDETGGYLATRHLIDLGHRDIAVADARSAQSE